MPSAAAVRLTMPCFYLSPKQDDFNKIPELQVCIAEALYDVDSIVADPGAYTNHFFFFWGLTFGSKG